MQDGFDETRRQLDELSQAANGSHRQYIDSPSIAPTPPAPRCPKCPRKPGRFVSHSGRDCGPCYACNGTGFVPSNRKLDLNVATVKAALDHAFGRGLKRPRLIFGAYTFSRAADTSANPGALYIKRNGEYLGKAVDSEFKCVAACTDEDKREIVRIAADPYAAAQRHGHLSGNCCACSAPLTDPKSVERMIGPICAKRYGWENGPVFVAPAAGVVDEVRAIEQRNVA